MGSVTISDETMRRLTEFKGVFETVMGEEFEFDNYVEILLAWALKSSLKDLLCEVDQETLLLSFQRLGEKYPREVYGYVADVIRKGKVVRKREEWQKRIGFQTPEPGEQAKGDKE